MALNNYVLNGPSTVIADDNRDPYVSWQHHLDRSGRGGVDLVADVGTPVLAPTPGTMNWVPNDGSAGNSCRFNHDQNPGWADVFSHLDRYVGSNGQHFNQGDIIAYSGNTGPVDQHLHRHLLDPSGSRQNPWSYFGSANPSTNTGEQLVKIIRQGQSGYVWQGKQTFGAIALVGPGYVRYIAAPVVYDALVPTYGPYVNLTGDQFYTTIRELTSNQA